MFKEGDYIVLLNSKYPGDRDFPINFIYKQRGDSFHHLSVYKDAKGILNGWGILTYDKTEKCNWRYALPHEIEAYEKNGGPLDVTFLSQEPNYEIY